MAKKWIAPLLLALPFLPVLIWGFYLPDEAYAPLRALQQAEAWPAFPAELGARYEVFSTQLFPTGVQLLAGLGLEPARSAALLGTVGSLLFEFFISILMVTLITVVIWL